MNTLSVLLASNAGAMNLIMIVGMVVIMYFFMIRPQQKKQKEITKFRSSLEIGDSVVTSGGLYGRIKSIEENIINLEIAHNVIIKVDVNSIFSSPADTQKK